MKRFRILAALPLFLLIGCTHRQPTTTVELIDTSLSISPRAKNAAFNAVRRQIQRMGRGDHLILIPVTGNAQNDAGGRTLRLEAPTVRAAYDADLRKFRNTAEQQFATWAAAKGAEGSRTDLLGSLDAARQELALSPKGSVLRLVVVSDFIEDDGELRFATDPALANGSRARVLAKRLRSTHEFSLHGVSLCLGRLESADYAALSPVRRAAIDAFWSAYIGDDGHGPEIEIDGLALLENTRSSCLTEPNASRTRITVR